MSPAGTRFIGWIAVAIIALVAGFTNPLASSASGFNREVVIGGTALYATLRAVSSAMSVVKDADVGGSIGVASVTGSPGQLLQPVTNTIERTADLLFVLVILSAIIAAIMPPVASVGAVFVAIAALCFALSLPKIVPEPLQAVATRLTRSLLALGIMAALLLPAAYNVAFVAGDAITASAWNSATDVFQRLDSDYGQPESMETLDPAIPTARDDGDLPEEAGSGPLLNALRALSEGIGDAFGQSSEAIGGTVGAARDLATSMPDQLSANASIIRNGIAISGDLFSAAIQVAVSYLVKLVVFPALILASAIWLLRATAREQSAR